MPSLNSCNLMGHLGRDPEVRYTPAGLAVCELSVAIDRKVGDQRLATWTQVVTFYETAKRMINAHKGDLLVACNVEYRTEEYEAKDGTKKTKHRFVAHAGSRCFAVPKGTLSAGAGTEPPPTPSDPPVGQGRQAPPPFTQPTPTDPDLPF